MKMSRSVRLKAVLSIGAVALVGCTQEQTANSQVEVEASSEPAVERGQPDSPSLSDSNQARYLRQEEFSSSFGKVIVGEFGYPDGEWGHVTSGRLDVAYIRPSGEREQFERAVEVGSNGRVGEWDVTYKFTGTPVIYASGGSTGQGTTEGCTVLTELTPEGPREIAVIPDYSGGMSSDGQEFETKGKIGNIKRGVSFAVSYAGQEKGTVTYQRIGGKFQTSDKPVLSHCGFEE